MISSQERHFLDERIKFFESMYRQAQIIQENLHFEIREKDRENERVILELKQAKTRAALLEEEAA